ncbi:MAG: hypothetical protein HGB36_12465 [Chlorobiaceae bacterium]|nr:hypothetical protein [Chlorobiaceae bacterium]
MLKRELFVKTAAVIAMLFSVSCTSSPQKMVDVDGNSYRAVREGTMIWTGENLEVSRYRNGDTIPEITDPKVWATLTTGAWCYNQNNPENAETYGKLYNWYAVHDPRGLAPEGWHVATDAEWSALSELLGGEERAGGGLKAKELWKEPNYGADNKSELTVLPAGARRDTDGEFMAPGGYSRLWSSTESEENSAWCRSLGYFDAALRRGQADKRIGFSIRCVKNKE